MTKWNDTGIIQACEESSLLSLENLKGKTVKILSCTIDNPLKIKKNNTVGTIQDIYFKVSLDGKCFTLVKLKEFPDFVFTLKDLKIHE